MFLKDANSIEIMQVNKTDKYLYDVLTRVRKILECNYIFKLSLRKGTEIF